MVQFNSSQINNMKIPVCRKRINGYFVITLGAICAFAAMFNQSKIGTYMSLAETYAFFLIFFFIELVVIVSILNVWKHLFETREIKFTNGSISLESGFITMMTIGANVIIDDKLDEKFVNKLKSQYYVTNPVVINLINKAGTKSFVAESEHIKELYKV